MSLAILGAAGPRSASAAVEFYDRGWHLVRGCSKVSPGCDHCTAADMASVDWPAFAAEGNWTGKLALVSSLLDAPLKASRPCSWLVCPTSDLFHPRVPDWFIAEALDRMTSSPRHRFFLLTKRPARLRRFFQNRSVPANVWPGTSVEGNRWRWRTDELRRVPAALRWISAEPLLGPLDLDLSGIGFVACGPEVGAQRRACDPAWMRDLLGLCRAAGVPFFTKHRLDGQTIRELPAMAIAE